MKAIGSKMNLLSVLKVGLVATLIFLSGFAIAQDKGGGAATGPSPVPLEAFTVNLQPDDGQPEGKFLQLEMTLQVDTPAAAEAIKVYMPIVRHRLLMLLTSKKLSEIATGDGKKALIAEVLVEIKKPFDPKGKPQEVSDVYITSFITQ